MKKDAIVPDWAKDAIWYQIFPERFCNGSKANDPRITDIADRAVPGWKISPWGMDWYSQEAWERKQGDFFKSVLLRRYGGDLLGVRAKLDYLQDLGVNAIYLNPIFQAPSLHKYDGASFHHIDPTFGPDRAGDLKRIAAAHETEEPATWIWTRADDYLRELVEDVHDRGMRLIIDGVFNHTGREFFAFRDLLRNGRRSRYRDWYKIKKWKRDGTFEYEGWFGHQMLPEFSQVDGNLAAPVKEYIFNITRRWMLQAGIDGWRLDVAFCLPHQFWRDWRGWVKQLNPESYTTAEIVDLATPYLQGDQFDAVMNYMWLFAAVSFFTPHAAAVTASEFRKRLETIRRAYPKQTGYVLQNLLDSHDVARILTVFENALPPVDKFSTFFESTRVKHNGSFITTKPGPRAIQALKQMTIFQASCIGAPMIYYGTEVGMWGANDPCDRQPMLWAGQRYASERCGLNGSVRRQERAPDLELFKFFKKAFGIRTNSAALRRGSIRWINTGRPRVAAYERAHGGERVLCAFNGGEGREEIQVPAGARNLWTGRAVAAGRASIEPHGWLLARISC